MQGREGERGNGRSVSQFVCVCVCLVLMGTVGD